ncbi:MAG: CRISPR system precrRNA processing endoribonuclease RAMP protein Cas6 [Proteobacteria bacterium]|nr:CRISPR system precrRNA processing endoribonuclease RAMP protein Cas6 [Pseudomonadota bacterium]
MIIPYQKLIFLIRAKDDIFLPYYKGSTFRGGFGNAFRRVACPLRESLCSDCILKRECVYYYVFETPSFENANILNMHKYERIPHPFVIEPPEGSFNVLPEGEKTGFGLILIGKAIDYIPYFIYTFEQVGKKGIGKERGKFTVEEVKVDHFNIYSKGILKKMSNKKIEISENFKNQEGESLIEILIHTPLRIKHERKLLTEFNFQVFIKSLFRRITLIGFFHCNGETLKTPIGEILRLTDNVRVVNSNTRWFDWERYSSRQERKIKLGGIIGDVKLFGKIEPFMEILRAGEILHAGKGTSFGLGRYEVRLIDK